MISLEDNFQQNFNDNTKQCEYQPNRPSQTSQLNQLNSLQEHAEQSINYNYLGNQDQNYDMIYNLRKTFQCCGKNEATLVCINKKCKCKLLFLCGSKKCLCKANHEKCSKADIQYLQKSVKSKIIDTNSIISEIDDLVQQQIDKISNLREQISKMIQNQLINLRLTENQINFMKLLSSQISQNDFTNENMSKLWIDVDEYQDILQKNLEGQIKTKRKAFEQNINNFLDQTLQQFRKAFAIMSKKILVNCKISQTRLKQTFISESSIIQDFKHASSLIDFFEEASLQDASLIYKASVNNFSLKHFYEMCGKEKNILILCKTNKNKIVGGFSPIQLLGQTQGWVQDTSNSSFLFSLSNEDKFVLKKPERAIYRTLDRKQLSFGNNELRIKQFQNFSNIEGNGNLCSTHVNWNYFNSLYKTKDKQSYLKLNGNETFQFRLKQWQCWKIQLKNKFLKKK